MPSPISVVRLSITAALGALLVFAGRARADTPCDFITANCSCAARADGSNVCKASQAPCRIALPDGFPCPSIPTDNALSREKIELGRLLFYDRRLSFNETESCASCHDQAKAFTDGLAHAVGSTAQLHPRSAMSLANVVYAGTFTWADKLTPSLEQQMLAPMFGEHPIVELGMGGHEDVLIARLQADPRYQRMFAEAFPDGPPDLISIRTITQAIASFERTLISGNSAFDRYVFGDDNAVSASALRGSALFFDSALTASKRECSHCHGGFNFTASVDHQNHIAERPFHNNALYNLNCASVGLPALDLIACRPPATPGAGTPSPTPVATCPPGGACHECQGEGPQAMGCYPPDNTGLYARTGDTNDMGKFKAPTLRNIAVTGPYMHDGSVATLDDVLSHYAAGGRAITEGPYAGDGSTTPAASAFMFGFPLSDEERADLLAFLDSLTDDEFLANPRFADPFAPIACPGDCDADGTIAISELVTGIGASLRSSSLALCVASDLNGDGAVTVDELIRAVAGLLNGCS